jgi:hypothetical protein
MHCVAVTFPSHKAVMLNAMINTTAISGMLAGANAVWAWQSRDPLATTGFVIAAVGFGLPALLKKNPTCPAHTTQDGAATHEGKVLSTERHKELT